MQSVGDSFYVYGIHCTAIVVKILSISTRSRRRFVWSLRSGDHSQKR